MFLLLIFLMDLGHCFAFAFVVFPSCWWMCVISSVGVPEL